MWTYLVREGGRSSGAPIGYAGQSRLHKATPNHATALVNGFSAACQWVDRVCKLPIFEQVESITILTPMGGGLRRPISRTDATLARRICQQRYRKFSPVAVPRIWGFRYDPVSWSRRGLLGHLCRLALRSDRASSLSGAILDKREHFVQLRRCLGHPGVPLVGLADWPDPTPEGEID